MSKDAFFDYINNVHVKEKEFFEELEQWRLQYDEDYIKSIKESELSQNFVFGRERHRTFIELSGYGFQNKYKAD